MPANHRPRFAPLAACLIAALVLSACKSKAPETPPEPKPKVGILPLKAQDTVISAELAGRTKAFRLAEVRPQVSGLVLHQRFQEGATVQPGQVLYEIDAAAYQATHAQALATLASAQADLATLRSKAERNAVLLKANAVSRQEFEEAQAAYQRSLASVQAGEAAIKAASVDLQRVRITAPIAGRIGRSEVTEGALVSANQATALATIQQLDPIHVDIVQSSQDLLRLRRRLASGGLLPASTKVTLRLEDGSTYEHAGVLKFSEAQVDRASGVVTLRAQFPNPQGLLLPGMYVRTEVEQGIERGAILVPQQAVTHNDKGEPTALVVAHVNRVEERVLRTAGSQDHHWIVTEGLKAGERLIIDGLHQAQPGKLVEVVDATPPTRNAQADPPADAKTTTAR